MKWYWKQLGGHTHVRVFLNGAKCGDLVFSNDEFEDLRRSNLNESTDFIFEGVEEVEEI